ncbi:hypothetical protein Tco_1001102 [Tanacetum coccineum]
MHNNIMAAGLRDRPPMLALGRYAQWKSCFLRYIDTRPNGDALRKCIPQGPYIPTTVIIPAKEATNDSLAVPERTTVETILNMFPENKEHYQSEKEAIHLLLTGIGDEIYSTGESLNIQDVKTNLFWEFGKFTSHDGELMESYYSRFYKMMNEMIRNNLTVATIIKRNAYYQAPKSYKSYAPPSKQSSYTIFNATTKLKGKEIAKPITPSSESAFKEDSDPEQAQRDKDMIPKRVKDYSYHKEKMLLCKQAKKGVPLQAEQADWLADTNEEIDEQELEAHYSYMAKIQEVPTSDSGTDIEPFEQVDSNVIPDSLDMCDNDIQTDQNVVECDDERVALANLIANLKIDVDENKKIQKQLKKANTSLAHELKECKSILAETSRTLRESNSIQDSILITLQSKQTELETYITLNDRIVYYDKLECKLNETLGLLAQKEIDIKEGLKLKSYEISVVKEKHDELVKQSLLTKSHYEGLVKEKTKVITDLKLKEGK